MEVRNKNFTELEVWKKAQLFKIEIKRVADRFPHEEKFRLADQLIRSSRSIGANVAEGHGRFTYKEQVRYCIQAPGSLAETDNHLTDALDCNYINRQEYIRYKTLIDEIGRLLNGYFTYLRSNI
jgi:four helix bundle protein